MESFSSLFIAGYFFVFCNFMFRTPPAWSHITKKKLAIFSTFPNLVWPVPEPCLAGAKDGRAAALFWPWSFLAFLVSRFCLSRFSFLLFSFLGGSVWRGSKSVCWFPARPYSTISFSVPYCTYRYYMKYCIGAKILITKSSENISIRKQEVLSKHRIGHTRDRGGKTKRRQKMMGKMMDKMN